MLQREPYIESKRIALGSSRLHFAAMFPSEDRAAVVTKNNRLLLMALDRYRTIHTYRYFAVVFLTSPLSQSLISVFLLS